MAICEVCSNDYDKAFHVIKDGETHTFDSFECAVHALAPHCVQCGVLVIGHGLEDRNGAIFCCNNCAKIAGVTELRDRL